MDDSWYSDWGGSDDVDKVIYPKGIDSLFYNILMKIITFNIRHGWGNRIDSILSYILKHNPDIAVITEFRNNNSGLYIQSILKSNWYIYQYNTSSQAKENSLLIVSKILCTEDTSIYDKLNIKDKNRVIKIDIQKISLYGLYFPQNYAKKTLFSFILNESKIML